MRFLNLYPSLVSPLPICNVVRSLDQSLWIAFNLNTQNNNDLLAKLGQITFSIYDCSVIDHATTRTASKDIHSFHIVLAVRVYVMCAPAMAILYQLFWWANLFYFYHISCVIHLNFKWNDTHIGYTHTRSAQSLVWIFIEAETVKTTHQNSFVHRRLSPSFRWNAGYASVRYDANWYAIRLCSMCEWWWWWWWRWYECSVCQFLCRY